MKYIIEFEDEYSMNEGGMKYHQCKQVPYWSVSHGIIKNLTPYTEPDRKAIEDEVWEFATAINYMGYDDFVSCFGGKSEETVYELSYSEVKAEYEAWKRTKEEIRVGDELKQIAASGSPTGAKCIVVKTDGDKMNGIGKDGSLIVCSSQVKRWWTKTGRSFPEVVELLKKMREEG